ncbi:hypothetical protein N0V94_004549 [Neodidymelliopsis sp. IMI 364377]|nr:hypothetical protein N0V94_004549 [Neodidymelliopsis sp. IMI 364377]
MEGINGSTKLIGINLSNKTVDNLYYLDGIKAVNSGIDDVQFGPSGDVAYLSDTAGALLMLNITTVAGVSMLADGPTAMAWSSMMYSDTLVPGYGAAGGTLSVGLYQIEMSPDGEYLYYQPCSGELFKMKTSVVDGVLTNSTLTAILGDYTEAVVLTLSKGGSTIDADGSVYFSHSTLLVVWKVTADGSWSKTMLWFGPIRCE